jgi:hypothetical protein
MIRKTLIWAIVGLLACAGLASESQASYITGGQASASGVTVNWAVYDKAGPDYGTGNAAVEAAFGGGSNFLYVYQVDSADEAISQYGVTDLTQSGPFLNLVATGPKVVDDVKLNGLTGAIATGLLNSTKETTVGYNPNNAGKVAANSSNGPPPTLSGLFGFTSAYGPVLVGNLSAQDLTPFGQVNFPVDIPQTDSNVPPPVPEPGTLLLSALALVGGFAWRRRTVVA